jgi:D-alanyl-D-alanine carboxypeptidase
MLMSSRSDQLRCAGAVARVWLPVALLLLLAACGQQGAAPYGGETTVIGVPSFAPTHYYPPPGPPDDPWGPYIREAAARYDVPEQWIRAVMQQESGGEEQAVSPVGAMGLMQVMPETYEALQQRYGLGDDPFDPHNNILAGAAYIREMYDRFGAPGFLAAYNAGPDRVNAYLAGGEVLPNETINYLAAVTPNLGISAALSGPFAVYASARLGHRYGAGASAASLAAGCDLDAAYDPSHPCSSLEQAAVAAVPSQPVLVAQYGVGGCDMDIAYDPNHPCSSAGGSAGASAESQPTPAQPTIVASAAPPIEQTSSATPPQPAPAQPMVVAAAAPLPAPPPTEPTARQARPGDCDPDIAFDPNHPCASARPPSTQLAAASVPQQISQYQPDQYQPDQYQPELPLPGYRVTTATDGTGAHMLALPVRDWGIQVGAFANPRLARAVAENARAQAPGQLRFAALVLPPTPYRGSMLYRARLVHLSASAASDACWELTQRQLPCVVVQPDRS